MQSLALSDDIVLKLQKLAECFDVQVTDNGTILTFKDNLCIYTTGNQIIYSEKEIAIKSKKLHLNPNTNIDLNNPDESIIQINKDNEEELKKLTI